jgi:hypothetical protein
MKLASDSGKFGSYAQSGDVAGSDQYRIGQLQTCRISAFDSELNGFGRIPYRERLMAGVLMDLIGAGKLK